MERKNKIMSFDNYKMFEGKTRKKDLKYTEGPDPKAKDVIIVTAKVKDWSSLKADMKKFFEEFVKVAMVFSELDKVKKRIDAKHKEYKSELTKGLLEMFKDGQDDVKRRIVEMSDSMGQFVKVQMDKSNLGHPEETGDWKAGYEILRDFILATMGAVQALVDAETAIGRKEITVGARQGAISVKDVQGGKADIEKLFNDDKTKAKSRPAKSKQSKEMTNEGLVQDAFNAVKSFINNITNKLKKALTASKRDADKAISAMKRLAK